MARKKKDADAQVAAAADHPAPATSVAAPAAADDPATGEPATTEPAAAIEPSAPEAGEEGRVEDAGAAGNQADAAGAEGDQTAEANGEDEKPEHTHGIGDEEPGYQLKKRAGEARRAAADAWVQVAHEGGAIDQIDGDEADRPEFAEAASYLLANPDAQPASIPVHLALQKLGGTMTPSDQEVMLWGVFADVFRRVYDHLLARDRAAEAPAPLPAGFGASREKAFTPQPGPFEPSALSVRD